MTSRKEKFLRAIQLLEPAQRLDLPLAFRWALNLDEQSIPPDLLSAARNFALRISAPGKFLAEQAGPLEIKNRRPRFCNRVPENKRALETAAD